MGGQGKLSVGSYSYVLVFLGIDFISTLAAEHEMFKQHEVEITIDLARYIGKTENFERNYLWKTVDKINPITWWQGYCSKSALKDLAVAILTLPPSSAATERTFSRYSFIHSKRRNKLTTKRAGMLTYVACNLNMSSKIETVVKHENKEQQPTAGPSGASNVSCQRKLQDIEVESVDTESDNSENISLHDTNSSIGEEADCEENFGSEFDEIEFRDDQSQQ